MKASHKRRIATVGYEKIEIKPGQFVTGDKVAARETGLSPRQLRTCKSKLEKFGKLTVKATNRYSLITIVNWSIYQNPWSQDDKQTTGRRQANDNGQRIKTLNKKDSSSQVDLNNFKQAIGIYENQGIKECVYFCRDKNLDFNQVEKQWNSKRSRQS